MATRVLQVIVTGSAAGAQQALNQMQGGLTKFGSSLQQAGAKMQASGRTLTRNVTMPLLALGGVAGKMAFDYEDAFTKISAVSNASEKDIASWREQVLQLAGDTAQAPKELAEALFFLASAGLETSQIMPTLEATAKAGAVGLGNLSDLAKIAANAVNAFADDGLTAAQAMDTLVAAVREGSAEPEEFAGALGRILPVAQKAGVSFAEVTASLTALSNTGTDVNEGVTAMRGLLIALQAPGSQAAEALNDIGISTERMREVISEQGILGALRLLEERTGGNIDQLHKLIPNTRALTGAFSVTGQEARKVNDIFRAVSDSSGSLGEAFAETEKGPAFQMRQGLNDLRVDAIKLGQKLLPIAQDIIGVVTDMTGAFTSLSPASQDFAIKLGLIAIAAGPVLRLLGGIARVGGGAIKVLAGIGGAATGAQAAAVAASGVVGPLAAAAASLAAIVVGTEILQRRIDAATRALIQNQEELNARFRRGQIDAETYRAAVDATGQTLGHLLSAGRGAARALERGEGATGAFRGALEGLAAFLAGGATPAQQAFNSIVADAIGITDRQRVRISLLVQSLDRYGGGLDETTVRMARNLASTGDLEGAIKLLLAALAEAVGDLGRHRTAQERAGEAAADAAQKTRGLISALGRLPDEKEIKIKVIGGVEATEQLRRLNILAAGITAPISPQVTPAQHGFHGVVTGPRLFFVEPGVTEQVDIGRPGASRTSGVPGGGGGGDVFNDFNFNIWGGIRSEEDARRLARFAARESLRRSSI